jgi:hypothetical protein
MESVILTGLVGFGIGVITTLILVLLVVIYNNTLGCSEEKKPEDEPFIVPISSIGGGGSGYGGYSQADIARAAAQVRAAMGGGKPEETPKKADDGMYL